MKEKIDINYVESLVLSKAKKQGLTIEGSFLKYLEADLVIAQNRVSEVSNPSELIANNLLMIIDEKQPTTLTKNFLAEGKHFFFGCPHAYGNCDCLVTKSMLTK